MARVDARKIGFQCPTCRHAIRQTVGWLTANSNIACPGCGTRIRLNPAKLTESVDAMEQAFDHTPPAIDIEL